MRWTQQDAGLWRSGDWGAANHPRVFPRHWSLTLAGTSVGAFATLKEAKAAAWQVEHPVGVPTHEGGCETCGGAFPCVLDSRPSAWLQEVW